MSIKDLAPWNWGKKTTAVRRKDEEGHPIRSELMDLQEKINHVFDRFWDGLPMVPRWGEHEFMPVTDIKENEKSFVVCTELPGMSEKDIEVSLSGNRLMIKGEKKEEKSKKEENYHHVERTYGSFYREFTLPEEVDETKIEASFKNGVLTVQVPKSEAARSHTKKVAVKSETAGR